MWSPDEDPQLCGHGINRRECVPCLSQWVDDLLDTQTWQHRAQRDLVYENARLRRGLAELGVEEPQVRVSPWAERVKGSPPPPEDD